MESDLPSNSYQQFLGIAGDSPDYYTLLDIKPMEADPTVISEAAQKRAKQLGSQKTPENEAILRQILQEIVAARDCLLDEKTRKQYELQRLLEGSAAAKENSDSYDYTATFGSPVADTPTPQSIQPQQPMMPGMMPNPMMWNGMMPTQYPNVMPGYNPAQQFATPMMGTMSPAFPMQNPTQTPTMTPAATPTMAPAVAPTMAPVATPAMTPTANPFMSIPENNTAHESVNVGEGVFFDAGSSSSSVASKRSVVASASHRTTGKKGKDNTPIIIFGGGTLIIVLILLGLYSGNTDTARANKLYIEAQTAVNQLDFDRGRILMDQALALERTVEMENYRKAIDIKQKKYEKRQRHEAARQEEDFVF